MAIQPEITYFYSRFNAMDIQTADQSQLAITGAALSFLTGMLISWLVFKPNVAQAASEKKIMVFKQLVQDFCEANRRMFSAQFAHRPRLLLYTV